MGKIAELLRRVVDAVVNSAKSVVGSLVRGTKAATKWVGNKMVTVLEDTWEWVTDTVVPATVDGLQAIPRLALSGAVGTIKLGGRAALVAPGAALRGVAVTAKLTVAAAGDAVMLPFRLLGKVRGAVFGGGGQGGPAVSEQAMSEHAAQAEEIQQAKVAQQRDQSEVLTAMRRCCACKAVGKDGLEVDAARLPRELAALLARMSDQEAAIIARTPTRDLQAYLSGKIAIEGLRAPQEIVTGRLQQAPASRQQTPEEIASETRLRHRAELREQIRGERRLRAANDIGVAA